MEKELHGSIRILSFNKGQSKWKSGVMRLYCQDKWMLGVRYNFQKQDQFCWPVKNNVKKISLNTKQLMLELTGCDAGSIRMTDFTKGNALKFKQLVDEMISGKVPLENKSRSANAENVHHSPLNKPISRPVQSTPRIPLSPKQAHTSKIQANLDKTPNPPNSSARKNISRFLEAGQHKSADKLNSLNKSNFYGSSSVQSSVQRTYGALGVCSAKRLKRPGLLPDPEHRQAIKRPRPDVKYDWMKKPVTPTKTELQGFSNLGNTCYMNAILQSLFHLPTFADDLLSLFKHVKKDRGSFPAEYLFVHLATLVLSQKKERSHEYKRKCLSQIKNAISASAKRFSGYDQHDAHEFLGQVLDQLKEETIKLNKVRGHDLKGKRLSLTPEGQNQTPEGHSVTSEGRSVTPEGPSLTPEGPGSSPGEGESNETRYDNPTIKNFEFTVLHTITCLNCGDEVHKEETFHDLSLDIPRRRMCPGERTLQDALDLFFRDEQIEYKCEECGGTNSHVHHKFTRLPRIIIMHLKRYNMQPQGLGCGKSGGEIGIPRFITLGLHCNEMTSPPFPPDLNTSSTGSDNELDLNKLSKDSPLDRDDTPSRRKLDFKPYRPFKHVQAHVRLDAARTIENENNIQSLDSDTDEVRLISSEDIIMPDSEDDKITMFPLKEQYNQRHVVAQVDGTVDPKSPDKSSEDVYEDCLDEEELKQMSEDEQFVLALQWSMRDNKPAEKQSTESPEEETDKSETDKSKDSPVIKSTHRNTTDSNCDLQNCDIFEDCDTVKESTTKKDVITVSDSESSGQENNVKSQNIFPMFRNRKTPNNKSKMSHSTPKVESVTQTSPNEKNQDGELNNIEGIAEVVFNEEVTDSLQKEFANDMFEDDVEMSDPASEKFEKKLKLMISDSDDNGTLVLPNGEKVTNESSAKEDDKENVTPPEAETVSEGMSTDNKDWLEQKQREDREKEEQELQRALQMSLQEQEDTEQREKDEIRRATELSLQELNPKGFTVYDSDDEQNEGGDTSETTKTYSKEQLQKLQKNSRTGELPYSYRLVSVVSHLGSSSQVGHYVSDALDIRKKQWMSYDDSHVSRTNELEVCMSRNKSGYVFFYCAKELVDELEEFYQHNLDVRVTS